MTNIEEKEGMFLVKSSSRPLWHVVYVADETAWPRCDCESYRFTCLDERGRWNGQTCKHIKEAIAVIKERGGNNGN